MGFLSNLIGGVAPIVGGIFGGPVGTAIGGALGGALTASSAERGARDRNAQQMGMTREQMEWQQNMSDTAHQREMLDLQRAGLNPMLSARAGASTGGGGAAPQLENAAATGASSAAQAKLVEGQLQQVQSAVDLNNANAMKARAEAWQIANYGGPEAESRINSAQSGISLNSFREREISEAIEFIKQQVKTEYTKRDVNLSTADLNRALEALRGVETSHARLGLDRSRAESSFYKEGAIGENAPAIKLILDMVKGVAATRGR